MGTAAWRDFICAASKRPIHCSALTAADTRNCLRAWNHFPHGPKRFARHCARRRGIPRTSRCKKEYSCPSVGTVYEVSSCATRCRYWVTVLCLPACKSSISRLFKSARKRAQTASIGFESPLQGGKRTDCMPFLRQTCGFKRNPSLSCHLGACA